MKTFSELFDVKLAYHDSLNSRLWNGEQLKPEVLERLWKASQVWVSFARVPDAAVEDVVITGGNVNYNWTEYSDIDVHVIAHRHSLGIGSLTDDYLKSKKKLWSLTHHIEVCGYPLEMYVQDPTEKSPPGQGVYSIMRNEWVQKPIHGTYDFEKDEKLKKKAEHYAGLIQGLIDRDAPEDSFYTLKQRIGSMRKSGIARGGEFDQDNLVFKSLRNNGYLDRMSQHMRLKADRGLSL